jgi:hypothetical protein
MKSPIAFRAVIIAFLFSMLFISQASAGIAITSGNGNWEDPSIWTSGSAPVAGDVIIIQNDVKCSTDIKDEFFNLVIFKNSSLTITESGALRVGLITNFGLLVNAGKIESSNENDKFVALSVADGDWSNPEVWQNKHVPQAGDFVIVDTDVTYSKTGDTHYYYVTVTEKGKLTIKDTAVLNVKKLKNFGDINNEGTLIIND